MSGLAARQSDLFDWDQLRSSGGDASTVRDDLRVLLVAGSDDAAEAYCKLENPVVSQGHLFECAPAVVSVIVAAVADDSVPPANLASALDLLGRIVAGYPDESEIDLGNGALRERCHDEARKGYWSLMRVACARDPFNAWRVAIDILSVLDPKHAGDFAG